MIIRSQLTLAVCALCALSTPNNGLRIVVSNRTAEKYVTPLDGGVNIENYASQDIRCI
jgi:hypothetical protein